MNNRLKYSQSYKSNANLSANGVDAVFTAAANVRGAIIHLAKDSFNGGGASLVTALIANTSAPTTVLTGDVLAGKYSNGSSDQWDLEGDIYIAAGNGVWFISSGAETAAYRYCLYTLL